MGGERRARDRPRALFYFILEVFMNVTQLPLFTHRIYIRSWCGKHWLIGQWRDHLNRVISEYLIEELK